MTARALRIIFLLSLVLFSGACGGGGNSSPPVADSPIPGTAVDGLSAGILRDASGLPSAILLSWDPVPDGVNEAITGYHIYRSSTSIPNSSRGDSALWLVDDSAFSADGNGGNTVFPSSLIPSGTQFQYQNMKSPGFDLNIGETWFFRFSAINESGDEGLLSDEVSVTIAQHGVTGLSAYAASVGDQIIVEGLRFNIYDPTSDKVTFVGRQWNNSLKAFEDADLDANILAWNNSQILVEVPQGSTKGRVKVWINGISAFPLQEFTCNSPYLISVSPYDRFLDQNFTITGKNFGPAFGADNVVQLDGMDVTDPTSYSIWNDAQVVFQAPAGTPFGEHELRLRNGTELTNLGFVNILNYAPVAEFSMDKNQGAVPLLVNFNAGPASDADDGIAEWKFDFGDGASETRNSNANLIFPHLFSSIGSKQVTLTVTDFAGATSSITKNVQVVPSANILLVSDQFNGAGPGNEFTANFIALTNDLDTLGVSYVVGGYSTGIGQVAIDQGFKVVIWNRGGPGPGDPIQNWPRDWQDDEKADFLTIVKAGIPTLLISQNNQFTKDFSGPDNFPAKYGFSLQNDTVIETGSTRDFSWAFGTATDGRHNDGTPGAMNFPSAAVCLQGGGGVTLGKSSDAAAELYGGIGGSGQIPQTMSIGQRIHGAIIYNPATIDTVTSSAFVPGMAVPDPTTQFALCFSYGLTKAPDANIGFAPNYSHSFGATKIWVIGWSYSEAVFSPASCHRYDVLHNVLAWLDSSMF